MDDVSVECLLTGVEGSDEISTESLEESVECVLQNEQPSFDSPIAASTPAKKRRIRGTKIHGCM